MLSILLAYSANAQDKKQDENPSTAQKIEELERKVKALEDALKKADERSSAAEAERAQLEDLKKRMSQFETSGDGKKLNQESLEDQIDLLVSRFDALSKRQAESENKTPGSLRLIDISADGLFAAGTSTASEQNIEKLQGGGHDPNQRGFTVENVELTFAGAVDPYFRGDIHVVTQIDKQGETGVELEEAYLTTLALPGNLQLKAGHYFTEFGRINPRHPHEWDFVDLPVISSRVFGADGLRAPGARLSWLAPTPFFAEIQTGIQNARGETVTSFLANPDVELPTDRPFVDRSVRSPADMLYTERLLTSFNLSDESTISPGLSALFGPNASGSDARTEIYGADIYYKWRALSNDQGWPFVSFQGEYLFRNYEAEQAVDAAGSIVPGERLHDQGCYVQGLYGFTRPWVAGLRFEYAEGDRSLVLDNHDDPQRDRRFRASPNITYYPSHFSKIRLQYNYDDSEFLKNSGEHSIWLQFEFLFGAHGAHKF
ncbi:MAG: hypothetical protein HY292_07290 [Planctomycetes bacterium]|nr:hypothetical protein [Planctomycetota bacterium]